MNDNFKYSVIGDNTPGNREHCQTIGINHLGSIIGNTIMTNEGRSLIIEIEGSIGNNFQDAINCIGNPQLFQAVTAMRDDSDYMQWFTNHLSEEWLLCNKERYQDYVLLNDHVKFHKATLEELKEHFQ